MISGVSSGLTDYLDRFEDELEQEAYVKQKSAQDIKKEQLIEKLL